MTDQIIKINIKRRRVLIECLVKETHIQVFVNIEL